MEMEILRRRPPILTLDRFNSDLRRYVSEQGQKGERTEIVMVTYNRVGDGLLGALAFGNGLTLGLWQGKLGTHVESGVGASMSFGAEDGEYRPRLTLEEVEDFYKDMKVGLIRTILSLNTEPVLVVVYGGEEEKFRLGLKLVDEVAGLVGGLGMGARVKFFLLTCNCHLAKKVAGSSQSYSSGRLECLVYNPAGECGGFADLQSIADAVLG